MIKGVFRSIWTDNIRAYQYFQMVRLLSLILLSVVLVQLGAIPEAMAQYEWVFFIGSALTFFWSMGLKNGTLNYYPKLHNRDQNDFLATFMVAIFGFSLFVGGIVYGLHCLHIFDLGNMPIAIVLYTVLGITNTTVEHIFLIKNKPQKQFTYASLSYLLLIFLVIFSFQVDGSIYDVISALILWCIGRFLYTIGVFYSLRGRVSWELFYPFILFSTPLMIQVLLGNGMEYLDGFLVKHFFENSTFAMFRYGARELPLNTVLITALSVASVPLAVKNRGDALSIIKTRLSKLMDWLFPLTILLVLCSKELFVLFYSSDYILSSQIFNIYLLIILCRVWMPQVPLLGDQQNTIMMYVGIAEFVVNIVLSIILLRIWGVIGIAYATLIAYIFEKIILALIAKRLYNISPSSYLPINKYVFYSILLILAFVLQMK